MSEHPTNAVPGADSATPSVPETPPPFRWTAQRQRAAALLASGEYLDKQVARKVDVAARTLKRWKAEPEFRARVDEIAREFADSTSRFIIASKVRRVKALDRRKRLLEQVVSERAKDPSMQEAPGGTTGLLCRSVKSIGSGDNARVVEEFTLDAALLRELREIEKQAAVELGQWAERRELSGPNGGPVPVLTVEQATRADEELERFHRERATVEGR